MRHVYSIKYSFNQLLALPLERAFLWCTDYQPQDFTLMKEAGSRRTSKLTDDVLVLRETTLKNGHRIRKTKLVRLNKPEFSWTNTHIGGPNRHSQFLYKLMPAGRARSRLYFTGLLVLYSDKSLGPKQLRRIAREERNADSKAWQNLAAAIRKENRGL